MGAGGEERGDEEEVEWGREEGLVMMGRWEGRVRQ